MPTSALLPLLASTTFLALLRGCTWGDPATSRPPQHESNAAAIQRGSSRTDFAPTDDGPLSTFRNVDLLTRPALFVTYQQELLYMDVSRDATLRRGKLIHEQSIPNAKIATVPNGSKFFVGAHGALLEFDGACELVRRIPMSDLGLPQGAINWDAEATQDTLWFTAVADDRAWYLCEWRPDAAPSTARRVEMSDMSAAFDAAGRRAFLPYEAMIVDFSTLTRSPAPWPERRYSFADYDATQGLLLSKTPADPSARHGRAPTPKVMHVNLDSNVKSEVTDGGCAVWGPDGWVYHCVGDAQLWRCKADGTARQPVYVAADEAHYGHCLPPRFDHARERVAFVAYWVIGGRQYSELVLIDIRTGEFRVVKQPVRFRNFAWLVADGSS